EGLPRRAHRLARPPPGGSRNSPVWARGLELFDPNRSPVGRDLAHDVADLVAIKAHRDHGVAAFLQRGQAQAVDGLLAAVGEQLRKTADLAAEYRAQSCTHVGEGVARAANQAENFAVDGHDLETGDIVHSGD